MHIIKKRLQIPYKKKIQSPGRNTVNLDAMETAGRMIVRQSWASPYSYCPREPPSFDTSLSVQFGTTQSRAKAWRVGLEAPCIALQRVLRLQRTEPRLQAGDIWGRWHQKMR